MKTLILKSRTHSRLVLIKSKAKVQAWTTSINHLRTYNRFLDPIRDWFRFRLTPWSSLTNSNRKIYMVKYTYKLKPNRKSNKLRTLNRRDRLSKTKLIKLPSTIHSYSLQQCISVKYSSGSNGKASNIFYMSNGG